MQPPRSAGSLWHSLRERAGVAWGDIARAWSYPAVRRGFYATAMLFLGSLTPAYLPQNSPWWGPIRAVGLDSWFGRVAGTALVVAAVAMLVEAWFSLRPRLYHEVKHWPITLLWSLPLLLAPPIFSHDAYGYAAEGWVLHNGLNPYEVAISALPGTFADQAAWLWRYHTAMYPPLSLEMFRGVVVAAGNDPYLSAVGMRVPALAGVALIVVLLPRIAHRMGADPQLTAWFATINPLLIVTLVGGAHNDAVMMGLVVLALWLVTVPGATARQVSSVPAAPRWPRRLWHRLIAERWFLLAAVVVGVAACIKQPAFLAFYPVALVGHPWRTLRWRDTWRAGVRLSVSLLVSVGTFAAISVATGLGFGWTAAADVPGLVVTLAPFTLVGTGLKLLLEFPAFLVTLLPFGLAGLGLGHVPGGFGSAVVGQFALDSLRLLGLGLTFIIIAILGLGIGRRRPVTFLSWSYLTFAFGGIALNSWYLTWGGLLLPLTKPAPKVIGAAVTVTAVLLAYEAGNLAWRNDAVALGFAALAVVGVLVYRHHQQHNALLARQAGRNP
jgi:alpha-1,6-mannosyltransferase